MASGVDAGRTAVKLTLANATPNRNRSMRTLAGPFVTATTLASLLLLGCTHNPASASRPATPPPAIPAAARTGYVEVDGTRRYYEVHGDLASGKTPLLVMHGAFMSTDGMALLVDGFAKSRPVIAFDARGHGRTGDVPGPISYELLADDAAGVIAALGVAKADVLGYSMGGTTAIGVAIRHPERVRKVVTISGPYSREGMFPEVRQVFEMWTPTMFAGSPMDAEFRRISPTPDSLPALVRKLKAVAVTPYGWAEDRIRALDNPTMILIGDADGIQLEHALKLFALRGGVNVQAAVTSTLAAPPRARLAVLPATTHVGMMARPQLIVDLVTEFLDDAAAPMPGDFLRPKAGGEAKP